MSSAVQVDPGWRARYRASPQAATNPIRYMMPYQCTLSGPMPNTGPIEMAMGLI